MALSLDDTCLWIRAAAPGGRLVSDSRQVGKGDVFFAYPGEAVDGRAYIAAAIAAGAAAIVFEENGYAWDAAHDVAHLAVAGLKKNAGPIAHGVLEMPDAGMFTVAVTGTNGKTSCAVWAGQALARLGETTAVIGTLGVGLFKGKAEPSFDATGYTTPDAVLLAQKLADMRAQGATALAIEASSIGLVQDRAAGMHFDVAIFTNLTRDHLDFHGDMDSYEAAKRTLFEWEGLRAAIVNLDDPAGQRLVAHLRANVAELAVTGYTLKDEAAQPAIDGVGILRASNMRSRHAGTEFHLESPQGAANLKTQLVGHFNVSNALAVLGALLAKGVALKDAVGAIDALAPAPGRMQQIGGQDAPMVVIDYAHTPDALEKTLGALRQVALERGGQLWCVFGCGGDRDPGKRPQMGAIAQAADHVLVTSDNPRSEEPSTIIAQIVAGMQQRADNQDQAVEDRANAILLAVKNAGKQDVILLAGKGHEPYQEIKGKKMPFSDADHATLALSARLTMMRSH
ncbi:UDP-N-acetylmuramoyl-L-alanyl-D-glutamate--2,6-diaminopimelate ligase [Massilia yuzhufengensis]|uniref:UDP-N-acetylmuramoyl-L-alanyl-D-glutamate--2,6-diaminopimelate ligase n=1 Tax=Massilia yuzhufengensis TaxID=1164594 RepID=A0A1I1TT75_9BURK|nr:UDP-N-acetylmuramoyl-L-alanyl-D-glutamate--2,6-diaminopimelate ligase [Massilia yuzhufengensis]SFD61896.1 UDP-N-acetylmuramoylalanyl-D-glutamate--2,6-diaminopimelate ligase [Massilia yuzhufengensis]